MKHLDLDAIQPDKAKVTVGGKDYELVPPTVADVVELQKQGQKMEKGDVGIDGLSGIVARIIPGLDIETLNIGQVSALVEFITEYFTGDNDLKKKTGK